VDKKDRRGQRKYEAPTITPVLVAILSPKARAELAHLVAQTESEAASPRWSTSDSRIVLDVDGKFQELSAGFCSLVGYAKEELLGKRIDVITASRTLSIPQHLGVVVHFGHFHCLWMFVHHDGHGVLVRSDWQLLPDLSMEMCCEVLAA
jgi:PAS domain-containing protein